MIEEYCFTCSVCGSLAYTLSDIDDEHHEYDNIYALDEFTAIWWRCPVCGEYHLDDEFMEDSIAVESVKTLNGNNEKCYVLVIGI